MAPKSLEKSCHKYKDIWSSRNELLPEDVCISSRSKCWFHCHNCGHEYEQKPDSKTTGSGCPFCSNKKLCGELDCDFCLPKSCNVYSDIWSSKNKIESHKIFISSGKKYLFYCIDCGHDYNQSPEGKTRGRGCYYCCNYNSKLCGDLDCLFCLPKSCYIYKEFWSQKNIIESHKIAISSHKKQFFNCKDCKHEYTQSPAGKTRGRGCYFCASKKLCGSINCLFCLPKSCNIYKEIWSQKNKLSPEKIAKSSHKRQFFICLECKNEYTQTPGKKTSGNGCPICVRKTERKVADYLKERKVEFRKEFKINSKKRYDFFIKEFNLIIEVDGEQHFRQVMGWGNLEDTIKNDIQKMEVAIKNEYSILRIYQPDIWFDKIDWKKCINDNLYIREIPDITCSSSVPDIYNRHE